MGWRKEIEIRMKKEEVKILGGRQLDGKIEPITPEFRQELLKDPRYTVGENGEVFVAEVRRVKGE